MVSACKEKNNDSIIKIKVDLFVNSYFRAVNNVAIFVSGKGSNALNLLDYFNGSKTIKIVLIYSTKENINLENACLTHNIAFIHDGAFNLPFVLELLTENSIDFIVLAGFLKKIPDILVERFPSRIINTHPSLLPKFGGKGMYGSNVHKAVFDAKEVVSGFTVHLVNQHYDDGEIISQKQISIVDCQTAECVQKRVQQLEMNALPEIIDNYLNQFED